MALNPLRSLPTLSEIEQQLSTHGICLVVQRKPIKNINFRVKPNTFYVSAPRHIHNIELAEIINRRISWAINANKQLLEKQKQQPHLTNKPLTQGDSILLWGQEYQLILQRGSKSNIYINAKEQTISCVLPSNADKPINTQQKVINKLLLSLYRTELNNAMTTLFEKWQPIVGKVALETRIKKMSTRWGSCNVSDARIWLSVYLAQFPIQCTEYVIVHELCHLHEANHSQRFWQHVAHAMPDYETWHNFLKGTGQSID